MLGQDQASMAGTVPGGLPRYDESFDWFHTQVSFLEGKVLTVVDASYSDREQREAVKSLMRKTVREWGNWVYEIQCGKRDVTHDLRKVGDPTVVSPETNLSINK